MAANESTFGAVSRSVNIIQHHGRLIGLKRKVGIADKAADTNNVDREILFSVRRFEPVNHSQASQS